MMTGEELDTDPEVDCEEEKDGSSKGRAAAERGAKAIFAIEESYYIVKKKTTHWTTIGGRKPRARVITYHSMTTVERDLI